MELLGDRSARLAATLAVAIAIPVAGLFYFQFRSISALSQSSAVVLRQLSQETANGITQSLQDALKAPYINVLLRVSQAQTEPLDLSLIAPALDEGLNAQPFVDRYYVWSDLTVEHRDEVLAYDREHRDFTTDVPEAAMLVTRFKELAPQKHAISLFETTIDGRLTYFQAQLRFRFPARDKLTIPDIVAARERPQRALMAMLAGVLALGVFFVVRAAAREVRVAEMKSTFVSSVSHDLKTPLALIQLFAETLELGRLKNTERAHEYYRIINSEARKLTRLINNLLDFSRIEAGLRRYRREPGNLGELTRRVLDSLESQFKHNQFSITLHADGDVPVLIDPEAADQALENLLSNAMKYSPDNREIDVDVGREDDYGVVRVTDRGVGIPARLHRKIFRKFYRVQTDAGSGPQGTGLGLAIVDHIMRGHGGFVRVRSEPGTGSTFSLHFPLYAGETHGDETDSGDRGRAADVARSA